MLLTLNIKLPAGNVFNQFQANATFLYTLFSGGREMENWHEIGWWSSGRSNFFLEPLE